jgi:hypothetical protein
MMVLMSLLLASCGKQTICRGAARDDYTMVLSDFDEPRFAAIVTACVR